MLKLIKYRTFDGKLFDSIGEAEKHLDVCYGEQISKLAYKIVQQGEGKYVKTQNVIHENLLDFLKLANIKSDSVLENPSNED